jgi:hypothetical protein
LQTFLPALLALATLFATAKVAMASAAIVDDEFVVENAQHFMQRLSQKIRKHWASHNRGNFHNTLFYLSYGWAK